MIFLHLTILTDVVSQTDLHIHQLHRTKETMDQNIFRNMDQPLVYFP